jgi:hypothetical protein
MLKVVVFIFFEFAERVCFSDSALDFKDSVNPMGCGS